ncbi:MAG: DNA polymerase III subunit gamma/tau [Prevotellaceae bacterium]|jgi:DNA polymerase-3 subunit gamma/tau|nr:DNA polymerase III subunit gamma/tau [Prevotellaceae bacterium]
MDEFVVSARKYRPQVFASVVGQSSITTTLKNSIVRKHLAHAYLFCGPRGVGKTTCARIFAKTINCTNPTPDMEACNECESCLSFNEGRSYSIHELDAASNSSVEDIRQLIEQVRIPPQIGQYSVYIIDEVHMLSTTAFNAFLKTLEEPPVHAVFILATTEKHKIIPTILSRCQIYDFNRIRTDDTVTYLKMIAQNEGVAAEDSALHIIAQKADGAMRDALSIFDQVVSFCGNELTYAKVIENLNVLDYDYYFKLTGAFLRCSYSEALLIFDEVLSKGFEGQHFISGLCSHFRDLLVCKDEQTVQLLEASDSIKKMYREQALSCDARFLFEALNLATRCDVGYKASGNPRLHVELCLLQISYLCAEKKNPDVTQIPAAAPAPAPAPAAPAAPAAPTPAAAPPAAIPPKETPSAAHPPAGELPKTVQIRGALTSMPEKIPPTAATKSGSAEPATATAAAQELTDELLQKACLQYAAALPEQKTRVKNAVLSARKTIGDDKRTISMKVDNELILREVEQEKASLVYFLQQRLHNAHATVEFSVEEEPDARPVKPYGNENCYKFLAEQNPLLATLKQKLDLDYE